MKTTFILKELASASAVNIIRIYIKGRPQTEAGLLFNCLLIRAVATVFGDITIRSVVRPTEELAVTGVFVQEAFHPGHAQPTENRVVQTATVGAIVAAVADLAIGLFDVVRQAVIQR